MSDHWGDAVHTDHRNGEPHSSPTSWSKEGRQEHDAGRKVQVHDKPSHENQARTSHQEPAEISSFVHESKKLNSQFQGRLPQSTLPYFPPDMSEPWVTDITDIKVHATVSSLSGGDTQDDMVKQSLILAMVAERYRQEAWIHVFTDGSAKNAVTNGGAGIRVHFPGRQKASTSMAVGKHCSNYRGETDVLIQAASIVQASDRDCKQFVFLSDALSVLQANQNHKLPNLAKALQVAATRRDVLQ